MHLSTHLLPLLLTLTSAHPLTTSPQTPTHPSNLSLHTPSPPDPNYSTNYPGPIHSAEWDYYHHQYSPDWFRANLDILTATTCLCSSSPSLGAYNQVASYVRWDYTPHHHPNKTYSLHHICGPAQELPGDDNHCWSSATGSDYHGEWVDKGLKYCMFEEEDGQTLCVDWATRGKGWMTFHGHKRFFDREGVFTWIPEVGPGRVEEVCGDKCGDLFLMKMDVDGGHDPSFVKTWFPPKPIPWT